MRMTDSRGAVENNDRPGQLVLDKLNMSLVPEISLTEGCIFLPRNTQCVNGDSVMFISSV